MKGNIRQRDRGGFIVTVDNILKYGVGGGWVHLFPVPLDEYVIAPWYYSERFYLLRYYEQTNQVLRTILPGYADDKGFNIVRNGKLKGKRSPVMPMIKDSILFVMGS